MRLSLILALAFLWNMYQVSATTVSVDFYGEWVTLEYDIRFTVGYSEGLSNEDEIVAFYNTLEERPFENYITSLKKTKKKYKLNDWLYYRLVEKSLDEMCRSRSDRFQGVMSWFVMAKSGYDARATYTKKEFYVNVSTQEEVFESPMFEIGRESFANLSAILREGKMITMVYGVEYAPNEGGKDFSFAFNEHPRLKSQKKYFNYQFDYKGKEINISAEVDKTIVDIMQEYPKFDEIFFINSPLSESTKKSLLPSLRKAMIGMDDIEKLEFLVSFTRRGLHYETDKRAFGDNNRPLIAEEALYYPSVDCEDKVAVLYNLVKELTTLKGIVLAMPEHLSFAVALSKPIGKVFRYRGRKYTVCDPTGPENTSEIGIFPFNAELRRGEVLGEL